MLQKVKTSIYFETGMEGLLLHLYDPSKKGWSGHIDLYEGDYLEVPEKFKGYIKKVNGPGIKWTQEGWSYEDWYMLFYTEQDCFYRAKQNDPVIYIKDFSYII